MGLGIARRVWHSNRPHNTSYGDVGNLDLEFSLDLEASRADTEAVP